MTRTSTAGAPARTRDSLARLARFGGEEFAANVCRDRSGGVTLVDRIRVAVRTG